MTAERSARREPSETSQEYRRFEELARKLIAVPKKEIERKAKAHKRRKKSA